MPLKYCVEGDLVADVSDGILGLVRPVDAYVHRIKFRKHSKWIALGIFNEHIADSWPLNHLSAQPIGERMVVIPRDVVDPGWMGNCNLRCSWSQPDWHSRIALFAWGDLPLVMSDRIPSGAVLAQGASYSCREVHEVHKRHFLRWLNVRESPENFCHDTDDRMR